MKTIESDHIKSVGEARFAAALAAATLAVREDRRLVGLDKIRVPLAFEAALYATGFPRRGFSLGKKEIPGDLMLIIDDLLKTATQRAEISA